MRRWRWDSRWTILIAFGTSGALVLLAVAWPGLPEAGRLIAVGLWMAVLLALAVVTPP